MDSEQPRFTEAYPRVGAVTHVFDVAVIGGSIAGSITAILLARQGISVALIEKSAPPRVKPCGEGLSSLGLTLLRHHNLLPNQLASAEQKDSPFLPFTGFAVYSGKRRGVIEHRETHGVACDRFTFDELLWHQATKCEHVSVFPSTEVTKIQFAPGSGSRISVRNHAPYSTHDGERGLTAKIVVLACGSRALQFISSPNKHPRASRAGISAHFSGNFTSLLGKVHIFLTGSHEIYLTPLSQHRANIAVLFNRPLKGDSMKTVLLSAPHFISATTGAALNATLDSVPMGRSDLGNYRSTGLSNNVFLVGDSFQQFDPIGGMGMTHAIYSAASAIPHITGSLRDSRDLASSIQKYERELLASTRSLRIFTKCTSLFMKASAVMPLIVGLPSCSFGRWVSSTIFPRQYLRDDANMRFA